MKWINAEQQMTVTIYDEEHEEYLDKIMTVEEMLDAYTNEGSPTHNTCDYWDTESNYCTLNKPLVHERMSNKEWVDFLSEQFNVSRSTAHEMLHGLMRWKAEDNFKKQFSGVKNE